MVLLVSLLVLTPPSAASSPHASIAPVGDFAPPADLGSPALAPTHAAPVAALTPPTAAEPLTSSVSPDSLFLLSVGARPTEGAVSLVVDFNISVKSNAASNVTFNFNWTFGDGTAAENYSASAQAGVNASLHVSHAYLTPGFFNATAKVSDNHPGDVPTTTRKVEVIASAPLVIRPIAVVPTSTYGRVVRLLPNISGGLAPFSVGWTGLPSGCAQTGFDVNCTSPVGNHSALVTVRDNVTNVATSTVNFTVNSKLTVQAGVQPYYTCNGTLGVLVENFTVIPSGGTTPFTYAWSFGDGSPNGSGPRVSHNYELGATYNAVVSVVDSSGANASGRLSIATSFPSCGAVASPSFLPSVTLLQGGVAVLAVAVAVLLLFFYRGQRGKGKVRGPPKEAEPPAAPAAGATEADPAWSEPTDVRPK